MKMYSESYLGSMTKGQLVDYIIKVCYHNYSNLEKSKIHYEGMAMAYYKYFDKDCCLNIMHDGDEEYFEITKKKEKKRC